MSLFNILKGANKTPPPEPTGESPFAELTPIEPAPIETVELDLTEFDSEFVAPATEVSTEPELASDEDELEEWSEPLPSVAPPVTDVGALVQADDGALSIEQHLETRGGENVYRATWLVAGAPAETVRLREASGAWGERLARETMWRAHWEEAGRLAMLPRVICGFKSDELTYLATELPTSGPTLSQFFAAHEAAIADLPDEQREARETEFLSETLLLLTQVAAFLVRLHEAGFAHLGLRAEGIVSGKPVQILDCSFAAPLGEPLESSLSLAGYSAPELLQPGKVDARSDLYSVGALAWIWECKARLAPCRKRRK